jgi:hypothetical protein
MCYNKISKQGAGEWTGEYMNIGNECQMSIKIMI